ncbi:cytochrome-c peroxidase [Motiliproteus coralliicola]|uniref:cytochrome-c peroxidase n=1 Tax=Motiliproteus coralliicola TaxID=2283196 RepID=UPI001403F161|nr:cytochrome c peroxidase [Motiliproteus coralliicola]
MPKIAPEPLDNRNTVAKINLGRQLFFDKRLSIDGTVACGSCHQLTGSAYGADRQTVSTGIDEQRGSRNAPTVLNAAFQRRLFWDGRAESLEQQALGPLTNPLEMGMPSLEAVVNRVRDTPEYAAQFRTAFPQQPQISSDNIAKAIASYERTLITPNTAYDRFVGGEESALTPQQLRGMALFESIGCVLCHSGPNFSSASLFDNDNGLRLFPANPDTEYQSKYRLIEDRGAVADDEDAKVGVWRVPSLRNVSKTAPYFHNGSVDTLDEAVRVMASTQLKRSISNDPASQQSIHWSKAQLRFANLNNVAISDSQVRDIVAFLESLTGPLPEQNPLGFSAQSR